MPRRSRLVDEHRGLRAAVAQRVRPRAAASASTWSHPSSTTSARRSLSAPTTASSGVPPSVDGRAEEVGEPAGHAVGARARPGASEASEQNHTPPGHWSRWSRASSTARRLLPPPGGPGDRDGAVGLDELVEAAALAVRGRGAGPTARARRGSGGARCAAARSASARSGATTWWMCSGSVRSRSRCSPRSRSVMPGGRRSATRPAVAPLTTIWPPWATSWRRAVRFTVGPNQSPSRSWASPLCRPIRTRSGPTRQCSRAERALGGDRRGHAVGRPARTPRPPVAAELEDGAAVAVDDPGQEAVVVGEVVAHRRGRAPPTAACCPRRP